MTGAIFGSDLVSTTVERLNEAVYRHKILWTDLSARVVKNECISKQAADEEVAALITKRYVSLPVAVALIDLIVDDRGKNV